MESPLSRIIRNNAENKLPSRVIVYGVAGIGKTTFGASAPNPVFIPTEDGLGQLDVFSFPKPENFEEVIMNLRALAKEEHAYESIVIDTLDALETLIWDYVCRSDGKNSIEDWGYGKGYVKALKEWERMLSALDYLRTQRKMRVVLLAHETIERIRDPRYDEFTRHSLAINKSAAAALVGWADEVYFASTELTFRKTDDGRQKAIGEQERRLFVSDNSAYIAKSRLGFTGNQEMTYQIVLDGEAGGKAIKPAPAQPDSNNRLRAEQPEDEALNPNE